MTRHVTVTSASPLDLEAAWARAGRLAERGDHVEASRQYVSMAQALLAERGRLPPIELLERIARGCARLGEPEHAIRILGIAWDAAVATATAASVRTARHLGLVAAGVCLSAGDLESARAFLARELGEPALDPRDHEAAIRRFRRPVSPLDRFEIGVHVGRLWAAHGHFEAALAAFRTAAPAAEDAVVRSYYDLTAFHLWNAQLAADRGDWRAAAVAADQARAAAGSAPASRAWQILSARARRQLGRLSDARRGFAEAARALAGVDPAAEVQARLGLVSTHLLLNRLKDATGEVAALNHIAATGGPVPAGVLRFLEGAIAARRQAMPADLGMPFVPEQALEDDDKGTARPATPAGPTVHERRSERLADDWSRIANALLVAVADRDIAEARRCGELLERWTEGTDSTWLAGRTAYHRALVHHAAGELEAAREAARQALDSAARSGHLLDEWQATILLSWCHARLHEEAEYVSYAAAANRLLDRIASELDEDDRHYFLLNKWSARDEYVVTCLSAALAQPEVRAPWAWLRRALSAWIARRRIGRAHERLSAVMGWSVERRRLAFGEPDGAARMPESTGHEIDAWVEAQLRQRRGAVVSGFGTPSGQALCRRLDRRTAVLQWYVSPVATYLFLLTRHDIRLVCSVTTRVAVDEAVRDWREALFEHARWARAIEKGKVSADAPIEDASAVVEERGRRLAERIGLDQALRALPPGIDRLVVIPHDVLTNLAWAALPVGGRRLCEIGAIHVIPSAGWLDTRGLRRAHRAPRSLATLGVSSFGARGARPAPGPPERPWDDLPGAPAECDAVEEASGIREIVRLREGDATETAVLLALSTAEWFHAATHGRFDIEAPFRSRLLLAAGADLSLEAMRGVDLRALAGVVLSACEVQLAAVMPGQEMVSLPVALLHAGVRCVIAPLWKVEDSEDASRRFMVELYSELRSAPPAEALARVQARWARSPDPGRATPERWAGYVHFGS